MDLTLDTPLDGLVVVHDGDVDQVEEDEHQCFVPFDALIVNNYNQDGHCYAVGHAISRYWPPVQRDDLQAEQCVINVNKSPSTLTPDASLTIPAARPQQAATARMLKTADPTIVPTPMSPSVINVPITFTKSSGAEVAAAINVAPATSLDIFSAGRERGKRADELIDTGQ